MARTFSKYSDVWRLPKTSPYYKLGWVYNRDGTAYLYIKSINDKPRLRTTSELPFNPVFKEEILEMLSEMIIQQIKTVSKVEILSWMELLDMYAKTHFPNMKEKRIKNLLNHSQELVTENINLNEIDKLRVVIAENIAKLQDKGLKNSTISKKVTDVKQILEFAVNENYISKNPIIQPMIPKSSRKPVIAFTRDETDKIIRYFLKSNKVNKYVGCFIAFISYAGTRFDETMKLKKCHVKDSYIEINGKGGYYREITFEPFHAFKRIVKLIIKDKQDNDCLFKQIEERTYHRHLKNAMNELGIIKANENNNFVSFHAIRKMRENELIHDENLNIIMVAEILGHTPQVQQQHYIEVLGAERMTKLILQNRKNNLTGV